jgi:hypothetical protein
MIVSAVAVTHLFKFEKILDANIEIFRRRPDKIGLPIVSMVVGESTLLGGIVQFHVIVATGGAMSVTHRDLRWSKGPWSKMLAGRQHLSPTRPYDIGC